MGSEIEAKTARVGELGVQLVTEKEDLDDTTKSLLEDEKFLNDLKTDCKTKDEEWATHQKIRAEEVWMSCNNLHMVASGIPSGMQVLCGTVCRMSFFVLEGCPRAPARFDYFVFDPGGGTI